MPIAHRPCPSALGGQSRGSFIRRRGHSAFLRLAVGDLKVLVAQPHDGQDGPAAVGLDDRIDARIQPRADQRFDAGQGKLLELGIRQIDHLGHEIAAEDLVEILRR